MVSDPGGASPPRRVRRLKEPRPIEVAESEDGEPQAVLGNGEWRPVRLLRRPWRVDQYWWRGEEVSRLYFQVEPESEAPFTLFHDLTNGGWYRQEY